VKSLHGLTAVLLACALASCGGASDSITGGGGTSDTIDVADNLYRPANDTVAAGTTVTWKWTGTRNHTVTFEDGVTSEKMISGSFSRSFDEPGTYPYHCSVHGASMAGTVTVE
jgi:plastocyanin